MFLNIKKGVIMKIREHTLVAMALCTLQFPDPMGAKESVEEFERQTANVTCISEKTLMNFADCLLVKLSQNNQDEEIQIFYPCKKDNPEINEHFDYKDGCYSIKKTAMQQMLRNAYFFMRNCGLVRTYTANARPVRDVEVIKECLQKALNC